MNDLLGVVIALAVLNTGLLGAIFFRLGGLTERVSGLERRTRKLEGALNV